MAKQSGMSDEALLKVLAAHPILRERVEALAAVVEDETGDLKLADEAEMRVIEEVRRIGQEALQAWANKQLQETEQAVVQSGGVQRQGKKNSAGTRPSGKSS